MRVPGSPPSRLLGDLQRMSAQLEGPAMSTAARFVIEAWIRLTTPTQGNQWEMRETWSAEPYFRESLSRFSGW